MIVEVPRLIDKTATLAAQAAARNFSRNVRALEKNQSELGRHLNVGPALRTVLPTSDHSVRHADPTSNTHDLCGSLPTDVEWVFARDGSLTALDADGQWWAGCSLPHRAAQFMLKKAGLDGTLLCFLYPMHAAQVRVALDLAKPGQAVLALIPHETTLQMLLACDNFSAEIAEHRLYFAAGDQWETQLDQLLQNLPGLPTPTQFIRPILADSSAADEMISPAQKIFAKHAERRGKLVRNLRKNWTSNRLRHICLVAPSLFRLWDDAGSALSRVMTQSPDSVTVNRFNPDDPASASSAALAAAASKCDAIVTPNMGRADLPELVPDEMPWAAWITTPRIPSAEKAGPRDTLLVADPEWKTVAIEKGWNSDQVFVAGWPPDGNSGKGKPSLIPGSFEIPSKPFLAIISDTQPLDAPARVVEYSSHRLLWETIRNELLENPFALTGSADHYLAGKMERAHIEDNGFDRAAFLDGVVLHAWQHGLVRLLLREKLPLRLYGKGWDTLEEFSHVADGPIRSRNELDDAIASSTALIHAWPTPHAHPIEATGKPVIRAGKRRESLIRDAKLAREGRYESPGRNLGFLTAGLVINALARKSGLSA